jgi:hypothetical protein
MDAMVFKKIYQMRVGRDKYDHPHAYVSALVWACFDADELREKLQKWAYPTRMNNGKRMAVHAINRRYGAK